MTKKVKKKKLYYKLMIIKKYLQIMSKLFLKKKEDKTNTKSKKRSSHDRNQVGVVDITQKSAKFKAQLMESDPTIIVSTITVYFLLNS